MRQKHRRHRSRNRGCNEAKQRARGLAVSDNAHKSQWDLIPSVQIEAHGDWRVSDESWRP